MKKQSLPPKVAGIKDGAVTWKRLHEIDYALLGYFLSCHLIIEHYLDELLKVLHSDLDWAASRLTFAQKTALLSKLQLPDKYDPFEAIKHLNSLRNKVSHRVHFEIQASDLQPIRDYLERIFEDKKDEIPESTQELLSLFTSMVCACFAGAVTGASGRDEA